ncbi:amino acid/polyamine transporter I [Microdochium trichocladiopsis]|uniref:Amino acid/polyamine transporter I n=1 Tax=Microdochium trichocladiopsis TaxID=1682393 RepID=A0A9P9BLK6_9PEZI|nr:amino acid/polyamine transporter I [Microdochium trichocladiopsis]KAH7024984.1 amino acid/polyamine transporter I [Microdochium trichocladiopsis]
MTDRRHSSSEKGSGAGSLPGTAPLEQHGTNQTATVEDLQLNELGYVPSFARNRSMFTILFMSLSIAAVPYGIGGPLLSGIIGGGPLSLWLGLVVVMILDGCVAVSLGELASRWPTSAGTYYWTYQLASLRSGSNAQLLSYICGWTWWVGNVTITLSVNFGFASLIAATVAIYNPDWTASAWQLLLIFYAICVVTFFICWAADSFLPLIDTAAATATLVTVVAVAIALSVTAMAGRHDGAYAFAHYDASQSGWGDGFTFFLGLLPPAYTFSAIGMISSMAEEVHHPEVQLPRALVSCVPVGGIAALIFILPICFTLPDLGDIIAYSAYGQALPYIVYTVMGTQAGAVVIMTLVLLVTFFCSISITTTASRCTFAFARDRTVPMWRLWSSVPYGRPLPALALVTLIQMLLGLINLGSSSAFTAFVSVGVIALALGYLIPISISLVSGRKEVSKAPWNVGGVMGTLANVVAIAWILFELVLFSMPTVLPVTAISMNYASVVLVGFAAIGVGLYYGYGRKNFHGPGMSIN